MAVVGAINIAHVPVLPGVIAAQNGDPLPTGLEPALTELSAHFPDDGRHMIVMREHFERFEPDVVVFFDSDHFNTFFVDHSPSIAIGVDDETSGPSDHPIGHPLYPVIPVDRQLADSLHRGLVGREFDVSRVQRFTVDHSITVPLHFATPAMGVPIVPIWVNGLYGVPLRATRARSLGRAVREILDEVAGDRRVLLLSSGAISLDIGTPRIFPGTVFGIPDPDWIARACELIANGDLDTLADEATPERFRQAGNASAELLNVVAVMSALGESCKPIKVEPVPTLGHAYVVWNA